jgi:hypothetical protein
MAFMDEKSNSCNTLVIPTDFGQFWVFKIMSVVNLWGNTEVTGEK